MGKFDKDFEEFESLPTEGDMFSEFEAMENAKNEKTVSEQLYPETFEGKYLQPIYNIAGPVVKSLSVLEKPLSTAMAIGKTIGRGANELAGFTDEGISSVLEPLKQEGMSGIFPAPENTVTSGLRELGIGTDPLLEGMLPDSVKAQFPKASAMIEGVSPVDIGDMAASAAYGKKLPSVAKSKLGDMKVADPEIAKNALIRGSERDIKFVAGLKQEGKLDSLATKVIENPTIRKNLTNPQKMIEYLEGIKTQVTDTATGFRNKKTIMPGKLDEVGNNLSNAIRGMQSKFNPKSFTNNIIEDLVNQSDEVGSGIDLNPYLLYKEVLKYVKHGNRPRPFDDLVKIKRGAANRIFEMKQAGFANVDNPTFAEMVARKIWSEADSHINMIASVEDNFEVIKLNNEFSDLSKIRELYANKDIANKYIPSLVEDLIPAAALGGAATVATGSPYMGLIAAGGYPMARSGVTGTSKALPAMALNARMGAIEPALSAASQVKSGVTATMMASTQIPRNSDKIMAMKDQFISTIARNTKTPEGKILFDEVVNIMETNPSQIKKILPLIMQQYPNIFEDDPYNRLDGEVPPDFKQKAMEKIMNDEGSALEGANKMQLLIHRNQYHGE